MKPATKYIFMAIAIEIVTAIITHFFVLGDLDMEKIPEFALALIFILIIAYFLGEKVNFKRFTKYIGAFVGVVLMFFLLYLYITFWVIDYSMTFYRYEGILTLILLICYITTIFGGIQTFLIGLWLGYKLDKMKETTE